VKVKANGIEIEVDIAGPEDGPAVLLIMGLGMQLIGWPDDFVQPLVDAGYRVIRHDNRDIGLSEAFDHVPHHNFVWQSVRARLGLPVRSPYTLQDMANDSLGVLDALGIDKAHVIGASMGGMIAQRVASSAPARVLSLTSIMSSSGARGLPGPDRRVAASLFRRPPGRSEEALVAYSLGFIRMIESPAYPCDEQVLRERLTTSVRRSYRPAGLLRQMLAIGADTGRPDELGSIRCPTLVLHGEADRLVPIEAGRDTARRISGARFVGIPGMGHDLPPGVNKLLHAHIIPFLESVESVPANKDTAP
jgi:pimeloyl-ACP methyl ester carboxylesterase